MKITNLAVAASFLFFAACNNSTNTTTTDSTSMMDTVCQCRIHPDGRSSHMMSDTSAMNNMPMQMCVVMKDDKMDGNG